MHPMLLPPVDWLFHAAFGKSHHEKLLQLFRVWLEKLSDDV